MMKKQGADFTAAILMVNNTSPQMLKKVIAWLRAQAAFLQYGEKKIDKKYVARFMPVRGYDEK